MTATRDSAVLLSCVIASLWAWQWGNHVMPQYKLLNPSPRLEALERLQHETRLTGFDLLVEYAARTATPNREPAVYDYHRGGPVHPAYNLARLHTNVKAKQWSELMREYFGPTWSEPR